MTLEAAGFVREMQSVPWAMEPVALQALFEKASSLNVNAFDVRAASTPPPLAPTGSKPYEVRGRTAVIKVSGVLMRQVPRWYRSYGIAATSTPELTETVKAAAEDPAVSTIVLAIDSPGGEAQGVMEAGEAIFAARKRKRVEAVVDALAASGAYWIASQAHAVAAAPDAMVGSIGTYFVITDWSKAAEKLGVKVNVVRSAPHKGAGVMGAPVTDEQLASIQSLVDSFAEQFRGAVARGRDMKPEKVLAVATGEVWLAADCRSKGLVDLVEPVAQAFNRLAPMEKVMTNEELEKLKAEERAKAQAEEQKRAADILAAFPKHPAFAAEQVARRNPDGRPASLAEAKAAYADVLERELAAKDQAHAKQLEEAKVAATAAVTAATTAKPAAPAPASAQPMPVGRSDVGSSGGVDFMGAARAHAKETGCDMRTAMSFVARTQPALHEAFVEGQPKVSRSEKPQRV